MTVELAEYETVFKNEVYGQKFPLKDEQGRSVMLRKIIIPKRYTQASEDQVVEYLVKKAGEVDSIGSLVSVDGSRLVSVEQERSDLEKLIIALPEKVRNDLKTGDKGIVEFVRKNTPAPVVREGELPNRYLHVQYGVLPDDIIESSQTQGNISGSEWYGTALSHGLFTDQGLGEQFTFTLLLYDGFLPVKSELDVLLKHSVRKSDSFVISRLSTSFGDVKDVIDVVYNSFSAPEMIAELVDVSNEAREEMSIPPIIALHELINQRTVRERASRKR